MERHVVPQVEKHVNPHLKRVGVFVVVLRSSTCVEPSLRRDATAWYNETHAYTPGHYFLLSYNVNIMIF